MSGDLNQWFSERPKWLQIAAKQLFEKINLTDEDVSKIADLSQQEVEGLLSVSGFSFPPALLSQSIAHPLRLHSISGVEGINALAPKSPLEFGDNNLAVVYGDNASGKSGYVRLLKHTCGARKMGFLHKNVYQHDDNEQKATFSFTKNGEKETYIWRAGEGVCDDLKNVDIFDASFDGVFTNEDGEVTYEPLALQFFSLLVDLCDRVAKVLEYKASRLQSTLPKMPSDKKNTAGGSWYMSISADTTSQDIDKYCTFSDNDKKEMHTLQKQLAEQSPVEQVKSLETRKQYVNNLFKTIQKHLDQLSDENCQKVLDAKNKLIHKKNVAKAAADQAFSNGLLEGIGTEIWKDLWIAAKKYSEAVAYKESNYPNTSENSRCVLCHQPLDESAKKRLNSFEEFVKGDVQKDVAEATLAHKSAVAFIEEISESGLIKTKIDAAGIQQNELVAEIAECLAKLQSRKERLLNPDFVGKVADLPSLPGQIAFAAQIQTIEQEIIKYTEVSKKENRQMLWAKFNELQAKEWLSAQRNAVNEEIKRLEKLNKIDKAKELTRTTALSRKKGELTQELITDALINRFNSELEELGASRIRVELIKTKSVKGQVFHQIRLKNAVYGSLVDVLSEGEKRIVSVAAFLADVTGNNNNSPFVFDDPISSLDHTYEKFMIERLMKLSHERQVIIFTHRLSLLAVIRHFSDRYSTEYDVTGIRAAAWGAGQPVNIPMRNKDIKSGLNALINEEGPKIKKAESNGDFQEAESLLKSMCSNFRIIVECSIERDLLCGVVERYRLPVNSLKIKELPKMTKKDCEVLDNLMTKYSAFEHSQPEEAPGDDPSLDEVLSDMNVLREWRKEYAKR